ncbi:MAG TPA: helix-turn-helix domain-containing protein [Microbacterium sp.]|nr:helix-turn-helix domain-containing protein [Microbacterium sp.]
MSAIRPLRADAERNRARILAAAAEIFAERGLDVSLDDIAAHAGVGVGTVYRRFPDKDALIEALFEEKIDAVVALADEALEIEDPWEGFTTFMRGMCRMQAADRGFKDALLARDRGRERMAAARERIAPRATKLLARAQEAGVIRSDLGPFDVPMLNLCVGLIADRTRDVAPDYWERVLTIIIDGISAQGPTTPMPVETLDREAFTEAMASPRRRRS